MKNTLKQILIIDDMTNWRNLLKAILDTTEEGYLVQTAASLTEALDLLGKKQYGLVITNLGLRPERGSFDRSGLDIIDKLQELSPKTPCIIITAFDEDIRGQVEDYCRRYSTPIWVMWKWDREVRRELRKKVNHVFNETYRNGVQQMSTT